MRWDAKTEVRGFVRRKPTWTGAFDLPVRRWVREGKELGSFLC